MPTLVKQTQKNQYLIFIFKNKIFIFYKMESINKIQNAEDNKEYKPIAKNQSVEGQNPKDLAAAKDYKTRKYVQTTRTKITAEARRKRDQFLIDHKEEILKLEPRGRVKKVAEMIKQNLNLDVNFKTLRRLMYKYVKTDITNQYITPTAEAKRKRDQFLIDHKEEILKYDDKDRVKKVAELLKQVLNLDVNHSTLLQLLNKYGIISKNTEERKLRDQYLIDHREEILKLEPKGRIKKVQEMLKRDLNLNVNYNKMYVAFNKFNL